MSHSRWCWEILDGRFERRQRFARRSAYGFPIAIAIAAARNGAGTETAARNQTNRAGMNGIPPRPRHRRSPAAGRCRLSTRPRRSRSRRPDRRELPRRSCGQNDKTRVYGYKPPALKRSARGVPNSEDDNPRLVRSVENHIGIWPHNSAADIALSGKAPGIRVICEQSNHGLEPLLDVVGTLRRTSINVVENFRKLPERPTCVANLHSPCFAQTARTSSSVANSPCAASASEASRSAASSGVSS